MFKIYDGREHFYQWDLDRKLIVGDRSIAAVHFCNRTSDCALARDCYELEGNWVVDVPNICLQEDYRLKVYGYSEAKYTVLSDCFEIEARTKPEEYAYTEDEINCWQELDERLTRFEENIEEAIAEEVEAYLAANPIEKGATDAEKEQIARNAEDIAALKSLSNTYATEEYVDAAVANVKVDVDLTGYATEEYVNTAISNIEVGGGESEIEFVNATGDETIELDKTYDEIKAMVEAGKIVVILYNGELYYQFSDSPAFRYVGAAETRYIGFNRKTNTFKYSETILPTFEDIEYTVNAAVDNTKYIVRATSNIQTEKIVLDKEIDEIKVAYNSGKEIVIKDAVRTYELSKHVNNTFTFIWMNQEVWEEINVDYENNVITNRFGYFINDAAIENKLSGYATERYVNKAISGFATETYVSNALKPYAKTTDIPNVSAYQTAEQVNAAIANYVGVIENGTY